MNEWRGGWSWLCRAFFFVDTFPFTFFSLCCCSFFFFIYFSSFAILPSFLPSFSSFSNSSFLPSSLCLWRIPLCTLFLSPCDHRRLLPSACACILHCHQPSTIDH